MRLFDILTLDHQRLRFLLDQLRSSNAPTDVRRHLFEELHLAFEDHLRSEEADLYDLLEVAGGESVVEEARDDHDQLEQMLGELDECSPSDERFDERLQDLERALAAHVERAENIVFGAAVELLAEEQLDEIGRPVPHRDAGTHPSRGNGDIHAPS